MKPLLPSNPTPHEEYAYEHWMDRFGYNDRRCDYCESLLDLRDISRGTDGGVYCSDLCWHAAESTIAWQEQDFPEGISR